MLNLNIADRYKYSGHLFSSARIMAVMIVLLGGLGLSSCSSSRDVFNSIVKLKEDQPQLPAAELADLREGDFFTYSDDITHVVASVSGNRVYWLVGDTFDYETSRNIVFPWLKWSTDTTAWKTVVRNDIGDLWPLVVGNSQRYLLTNELKREKGNDRYFEQYDCWVPGTEKVTVPAGTFDTFVVACHSFVGRKYFQTNILYYAPAVGSVVKKIERQSLKTTKVVELKSYGISLKSLTSEDRITIEATFQATLQMMPSGRSTVWRKKDSEDLIETTPTGTYLEDDGRYCRDYIQRTVLDDRERSIAGRACRNSWGRWESAPTNQLNNG